LDLELLKSARLLGCSTLGAFKSPPSGADVAEAEAARSKAMGEKGGANAAVAAITAKAKLAGLWREKVATDPSGEHAPRYIISDRPMTEEEWIRERCGGE
jgi:hypothetical protein